jgi:hypothetical protein
MNEATKRRLSKAMKKSWTKRRQSASAKAMWKAKRSAVKPKTNSASINHQPYYAAGKIETIDVIDDICQFYTGREASYVGSIIRYISRAPHKEKTASLEKAQWYLNRLVQQVAHVETEVPSDPRDL